MSALDDHLVNTGMGRDAALIWGSFLGVWDRLLTKAHGELISEPMWSEFKEPITSRPHENDLTVGLYHRMVDLIDSADIDDPIRDYVIKTEDPVPDRNRRGSKSRRADFKVERRYPGVSSNHLAVEAKRILVKNDITTKYLGEEGLGCFLTKDSPYCSGPVGILLAYTFDATAELTEEIITSITNASQDDEIGLRLELKDHAYIALCKHNRKSLSLPPIVLMHSSLAFPD
ncbi:hypothetical protein ACFL12_01175 [Pseudomonadota bacterium]